MAIVIRCGELPDASENGRLNRLFFHFGAYTTIAIGDGGNELYKCTKGYLKGIRSCKERTDLLRDLRDHTIPSGISNWGAYALVAALSVLSGRCLMRPPEHELPFRKACPCRRRRWLHEKMRALCQTAFRLERLRQHTDRHVR